MAAQALADEGRLTLTPSVEVSQSFDSDEVTLQNGEESGSVFEVVPAFRARAERPETGTKLDLQTSVRSRSSTADSDLSAVDETGKLAFQTRITPRFSAIANGSFRNREAQDPLDRDDPTELQVGRPNLHEYTGDLTLAYSVTARSQVSIGYSAFARDFRGSEAEVNRNRDVDVDVVTLGYSTALTPLDRVGLSASFQTLNFGAIDSGIRLKDQKDTQAALFASWTRALSPMWTADLTAGVRRLKSQGGGFTDLETFNSSIGDAAAEDESTGFVGGLSFTRETEWNRTRIGYTRETRPSGGVGTSLDVDSFQLSFTQRLMRNLSFKLTGNYEISKSASEQFVPVAPIPVAVLDENGQPIFIGENTILTFPFCGDEVRGRLGSDPVCLVRNSNAVDTNLFRIGGELSWRWTRGFVTFLSYDFRNQKVDGVIGGDDRNSSRVRFGFRYAYDYEAF